MTSANDIVVIKLLDREYQIKCPVEKIADLQEAARYLEGQMKGPDEKGKTISSERFMIAALNITNELLTLQRQKHLYLDAMDNRIKELQNKIEEALVE